ncbi:MAG: TrkH family potassium uptake protein [Methanobrevibacter sp.]|uniref:TrkH family potassium uptake protein n=1 Tax=Methanobrevibacter sp. TaxID=66852 RepID=UPI0025EC4955|nr:TrkH family potassium uptake protein [Methanobrevibacter sp.]MBR0270890.1 TrkH family potassium uptake protein [Methanobrevibacter sp.]
MRYINKNDLMIVARNSGMIMIGIGVLCLVPIIVDLIYFEFNFLGYLIPALISIGIGLICVKGLDKYTKSKLRLKHGMIISSIAWLWASIICGLVMLLVTNLGFVDGVFESMSALTGSGITMYRNVEILPQSILFFRSLQQWVGGLGVVVMIIAILTRPGTTSSKLYESEAREERIKPSVRATLKQTIKIYLIYTAAGIILYLLAGMPLFDSVCTTFSIISTGGMSIKNANIGYYHSDIIYFITIILMILGATSFLVHYKVIKTRGKSLIQDLQFKVMISLIAISTIILYFASNIIPIELLFTVVSAVTTTGATVQGFEVMSTWPSFVLIVLMALMTVGGSSGSTVGALKLMRVITFFKGVYKHIREILSPEGRVIPMQISGQKLTEKAVAQSGNYITLYLLCILFTWALFCLYGHDPFRSLFDTMSIQGNVGLELGEIVFSLETPLKVISIFNMWTGRLEIYPVLITLRAVFEIFKR